MSRRNIGIYCLVFVVSIACVKSWAGWPLYAHYPEPYVTPYEAVVWTCDSPGCPCQMLKATPSGFLCSGGSTSSLKSDEAMPIFATKQRMNITGAYSPPTSFSGEIPTNQSILYKIDVEKNDSVSITVLSGKFFATSDLELDGSIEFLGSASGSGVLAYPPKIFNHFFMSDFGKLISRVPTLISPNGSSSKMDEFFASGTFQMYGGSYSGKPALLIDFKNNEPARFTIRTPLWSFADIPSFDSCALKFGNWPNGISFPFFYQIVGTESDILNQMKKKGKTEVCLVDGAKHLSGTSPSNSFSGVQNYIKTSGDKLVFRI